jgi:hypothetical protein
MSNDFIWLLQQKKKSTQRKEQTFTAEVEHEIGRLK